MLACACVCTRVFVCLFVVHPTDNFQAFPTTSLQQADISVKMAAPDVDSEASFLGCDYASGRVGRWEETS